MKRQFNRFQCRRYWPSLRGCADHRPRIFGSNVRLRKARRMHWREQDKKYNPLWGRDRWVNREWPDDHKPFRVTVQTLQRRRKDWIYRMQLAAYRGDANIPF